MYNQTGVDALDAVRAVVGSFGAPLLFRKCYGILNALEMHIEETPYRRASKSWGDTSLLG